MCQTRRQICCKKPAIKKKRVYNITFKSLPIKYIAQSELSKETKGPTNKARGTLNLPLNLFKNALREYLNILLSIHYIPEKVKLIFPGISFKAPYSKMFQCS